MARPNWVWAAARSKLAEILEKILKAELIRIGWELEKTHDTADDQIDATRTGLLS
jgi:hypothetical protein